MYTVALLCTDLLTTQGCKRWYSTQRCEQPTPSSVPASPAVCAALQITGPISGVSLWQRLHSILHTVLQAAGLTTHHTPNRFRRGSLRAAGWKARSAALLQAAGPTPHRQLMWAVKGLTVA